MKKLVLIDGNSLLFRAFFAMRPMVTAEGIQTQGIFAFINMLNKILNDNDPDYIAVAFDMKEKTFRHEKYQEYKAGRLATPIELLSEIPLLHQVLDAMNIAILEMPKYEADDLIGTVAKKASSEGINTIIITGDKDELQLIDDNTTVFINKKGMSDFDVYDVSAMQERYSLTPLQFIDLKGLMGDKSDNIPGIPSVGEKKGIALLSEYGSLEEILNHSDEIKGKLGEAVRANKEQAILSKWLATINTNSPIDINWDELKYVEPSIPALIDIYTKLEFSSFIKKLNSNYDTSEINNITNTFKFEDVINEYENVEFGAFLDLVSEGSDVTIEYVSDNNHIGKADLSKLLILSENNKAFTYLELTDNSCVCINALSNKKYYITAFDIKKLMYSFVSNGQNDWNLSYDPMIAEYLLDPNRSKYLLDKMSLRYNSISVSDEDISLHENEGPIAAASINSDILLKRAVLINSIKSKQVKSLKEKDLYDLFINCELPLALTLAEIEFEGITVDKNVLKEIGAEISQSIISLENDIYTTVGEQFNINSPKQLGIVLFEKLNLPYPKSKGNSYSTAADILDKLKDDYPVVNNILEYRKLSKLKSTYIDGLSNLICKEDNKIRPHFQQTVAATGRLSCTEPNLQNIPIKDDYGRLIRKAFIVSNPDNVFIGSDYSQIELRILASLSGDEVLIDAFNQGKDIHRATASSVFNIPFDEVSVIERSRAKAVNFGVVYGMSGFGLSENLDISRAEGQKYINDYFSKHTAVKSYLDKQIESGEINKEVRTHYGRLRQIPEFNSRKYMEREAAKRLAMNTPIQGTAADIIKFAMNNVRNELKNNNYKSRLILQIHDELIIEGPESELEDVRNLLENCMKSAADLAVSLECDVHYGKTWYELK